MTISPNKKVSVVVPNYNYGKYISNRIKSILRQTYPIYELIILDDASTDDSETIINRILPNLKRQNPNIKISFIKNSANSGKAISQWKKGFELAKGDYIWIAEADDLSNKRFLEKVMKGFDDQNVVISYTESVIINSAGLMLAPNFRWSRDKEKTGHYSKSYIKDGKNEIEEIMAIRCTIPNVSAVVFKKNKNILKYLDEALKFNQVGDWYFYSKLLENGKIAYHRQALNKFRIHHGSKTRQSNENGVHSDEIKKMHNYFLKHYKLNDLIKERIVAEEERVKRKHDIIK